MPMCWQDPADADTDPVAGEVIMAGEDIMADSRCRHRWTVNSKTGKASVSAPR